MFTTTTTSTNTATTTSGLRAWGGLTVPAKKREFPFHDPAANIRVDDWDTDLVSTDSMYVMVSGQAAADGKDLDTLVIEGRVPILCITATLYREIRYLVRQNSRSELAMFLTMKKLHETKPIFLAFDFFMPGQEASSGGVSLDAQDCRKYFNALKDIPYYKENGLHRHLCHLHSHGSMEAFWSTIDDAQQFSKDDLGHMDAYRLYAVTNAAGEIKCSLVTYTPVVTRVDAVVAVSFSRPSHIEWLSKKRKAELDVLFKEMVVGSCTARISDIFDDAYFNEFSDFHGCGAATAGARGVTPNLVNPAQVTHAESSNAGNNESAENGIPIIPSIPECVSVLTNFLFSSSDMGTMDVQEVGEEISGLVGKDWYAQAKASFIGKVFEGEDLGEDPVKYDVEKAAGLFACSLKLIIITGISMICTAGFKKTVPADEFGAELADYMISLAEMYNDPETFLDMLDAYTECVDINDPTVPSEDVARLVLQFDELMEHHGFQSCSEDLTVALMTDLQYIVKFHTDATKKNGE